MTKYAGQDADEDYTCALNPELGKAWYESMYGDIAEEVSELINESSGYEFSQYCANGVFIKATLAALALAFSSFFF